MYYAAVNSYATETSIGFANTWGVLGFATKSMRDAYVDCATDLATKAITSKDLGKYDAKLGQISYYDAVGDLQEHAQRGEFTRGGVSIDPATAKPITSNEEYASADYWAQA